MKTRKIEVTTPGGFKEGHEHFAEGDVRTVSAELGEKAVRCAWAKFVDDGPEVEVVGTPDNVELDVQNTLHKSSATSV